MALTMHNHVKQHPVMWIPLVLVGSLLYWTVALGLGGMSLSLLGTTDEELVTCPGGASVTLPSGHGRGPFDVRLVSGTEVPAGVGGFHADDGTGRLPAIDQPTPPPEDTIGRTSY